MITAERVDRDLVNDLASTLARKVQMPENQVIPFVNIRNFLTEFLLNVAGECHKIVAGGLLSDDINDAVTRSRLECVSAMGDSPFAGSTESIVEHLDNGNEVVLLANPNRVTGANFGFADLELLARAVPRGWVVIDEYYHDFYGITGMPLVNQFKNVIVLRSLTGPFGIDSDESGFAVTSADMITTMAEATAWTRFSPILMNILCTTLASSDALSIRLKTLHDESLRLTNAISPMGVQVRVSATDFLLIRVADPDAVSETLTERGLEVTNLHRLPGMQNYLKYRIQSPLSNDAAIKAFRRVPEDILAVRSTDKRKINLRRPGEGSTTTMRRDCDVVVSRAGAMIES